MPSENRRARDRRAADFLIKAGACERRPLSADEVAARFTDIDVKAMRLFGVRTCSQVELDGLHALPDSSLLRVTPAEPTITFIAYAAWRQRDDIVRQLLRGGADPAVRHPHGNVLGADTADAAEVRAMLAELSRAATAAAVFVVKQVVRLRFVTAREQSLRGSEALPPCGKCGSGEHALLLEPCGHTCCEPCLWRRLRATMLQDGEMSCPVCFRALLTPGHQGCARPHDPPGAPPLDGWLCGACSYENVKKRTNCRCCGNCRSCGALPLTTRVTLAPPPAAMPPAADAAEAAPASSVDRVCHHGGAAAPSPLSSRAARFAAAAAAACACAGALGLLGAARVRLHASAPLPSALLALSGACALTLGARARAHAQGISACAARSAARASSGGAQPQPQRVALLAGCASAACAPAGPAGIGDDADFGRAGSAFLRSADSALGQAEQAAAARLVLQPGRAEMAASLAVLATRRMGASLVFLTAKLAAPPSFGVELPAGFVARAEQAIRDHGERLQLVIEGAITLVEARSTADAAGPTGAGAAPACAADGGSADDAFAGLLSVRQAARPAHVLDALAAGSRVRAVGVLAIVDGRLEIRARALLRETPAGRGERAAAAAAAAADGSGARRGEGSGGGEGSDCGSAGGKGGGKGAAVGGPASMLQPDGAQHRPRRSRRFKAKPPAIAAAERARRLDISGQREELRGAAVAGDALRMRALASAGVDVARLRDSYGCPAVVVAALHGRAALVESLLFEWHCDPDEGSVCGATAATVAAARGHTEVLRVLEQAGADLQRKGSYGLSAAELAKGGAPWLRGADALPTLAAAGEHAAVASEVADWAAGGDGGEPRPVCVPMPPAGTAPSLRLHRLISRESSHPGAGSCAIDGGFDAATLDRLIAAFRTLPLEPRCKGSAENDRAYLPDSEGWISAALRRAVVACGPAAPCAGEAMVQMRFLLYAEAGGGLPAHVDLARTDETGRRSTHTFILYLTGCEVGGETQLLEDVSARSCNVLASVTPARGRLLLFPHVCPHLARPVLAEGLPKLLLRGEMY